MPKKTWVLFLLSVSLIVALAGCGGGGGSTITPRTLSTDYYGMEVGAKYSYHYSFTNSIDNTQSNENNFDTVVYSVDTSTPGTSTFKVGQLFNGSSSVIGEYVSKVSDNYYSKGTWTNNGTPDVISGSPELMMSNPIEREFSGAVVGQETVIVPAGTFQAYVLEIVSGTGTVETTKYWFVPYIYGYVKKTADNTINGVLQSHTEIVLTSTQFGVNATIPTMSSQSFFSAKSIQVNTASKPYRKQ